MKERPILFSGPMVRSILEGRKTQTRRVAKVYEDPPGSGMISPIPYHVPRSPQEHISYCPHGVPGDRLWVKETWARVEPYPSDADDTADKLPLPVVSLSDDLIPYWRKRIMYRAGLPLDIQPCDIIERGSADKCWRTSIFMPRWASRITLEIAEVRVQRLQAISETDAVAEGIEGPYITHHACSVGPWASDKFRSLWDSINVKRGFGWDTNPWVWAITFRKAAKQAQGS